MKNILFVCTGNTCRSSMAEAIARYLLLAWQEQDVEVTSAGLYAEPGQAASENAINALKEAGLDLCEHQARQLTADMIDKADIVLTMTRSHKNMVLSLVPQAEGKVFSLTEYVMDNPSERDITDPYGCDSERYRQTAKELGELVEAALIKFTDRH